MSQIEQQKWILRFILINVLAFCVSAQGAANVESVPAPPLDPSKTPAVAAPIASAPVASAPVVGTPAVGTAPVVETPAVAVNPGVSTSPEVTSPDNGITGITTEHKNADGSIITVTKFNGQLPANAFQQHFPQLFNPFGSSPFYSGPLYTSWGPQTTYRAVRSIQNEEEEDFHKKLESKLQRAIKDNPESMSMNYKAEKDTSSKTFTSGKKMEPRERVSEKFHYPIPPPDYFTHYKKPFVPVVDVETSDLI